MAETDQWIETKALWAKELELRRRLKQATTLAEEQAILEDLANLPTGPDVQDYLETESAQQILEGSRLRWENELAADPQLDSRAREIVLNQRMASLREELIADRPDLYLDVDELAHRYQRFPRDELTPEQREAVEEFYGPEDGFWAQPDDIL